MNSFYIGFEDPKLKQFIGIRMDYDLFHRLENESHKENKDISKTIRELCQEALTQRIYKQKPLSLYTSPDHKQALQK